MFIQSTVAILLVHLAIEKKQEEVKPTQPFCTKATQTLELNYQQFLIPFLYITFLPTPTPI